MRRMKARKFAAAATAFVLLAGQGGAGAALPEGVDLSRLPPDGGPRFNRLVFEKSPYLLLHAGNPVDWYPWGDEAFAKARREQKPIFLSIGYSTCHWCHVMEEESFSDAAVAAVLNGSFVSIKVDREERPDIDRIYLAVSEILTGSSGWPLTVLLTPGGKPFYAATYLPRQGRGGRPGLLEILPRAAALWRENRAEVAASADKVVEVLGSAGPAAGGEIPGAEAFEEAYRAIAARFDEEHGGFLPAPKFPRAHMYHFLLRYAARTGGGEALRIVDRTLTALRLGGIYDQLGGGFHRYATDREFARPHFEKMLYDQALLATAYMEAWQVTKKGLFADTAREVLDYVLRDLTSPEGGFYSAEDADSEGVEGKFYLWTRDEIVAVLGEGRGAHVASLLGVLPWGGDRDEAAGAAKGSKVLRLASDPGGDQAFAEGRAALRAAREGRARPPRDDKIVAAWNGLMIAALARGGALFKERRYTAAAEKAARFVLEVMRDPGGRLLRRYRDGEAAIPAYLEDYAFVTEGLIELYESDLDPLWLRRALDLGGEMIRIFGGDEGGGFVFSGEGNERLVASMAEGSDGALPSGASAAVLDLLRLARLTGNEKLEERAVAAASALAGEVRRSPAGHTTMLSALDFLRGPTRELVVAGPPGERNVRAMLGIARRSFRPNFVLLLRPPGEAGEEVARIAPFTGYMEMKGGMATAYLCENFTCKAPVTDLEALMRLLP